MSSKPIVTIHLNSGFTLVEIGILEKIIGAALRELQKGDTKYGPHPGPRRGLGALKAELQELTTEVEAENEIEGQERLEAIQVIAMGIKYVRDCCPEVKN